MPEFQGRWLKELRGEEESTCKINTEKYVIWDKLSVCTVFVVPTERLIVLIHKLQRCQVEAHLAWHLVRGLLPHCSAVSPLPHQLQFVLTIIQTTCGVIWPCAFPLGWLYFQIGYMISLIILFTNFYIQVSLTLLWQLGFGALSAKALICPFKGYLWSPCFVPGTGL